MACMTRANCPSARQTPNAPKLPLCVLSISALTDEETLCARRHWRLVLSPGQLWLYHAGARKTRTIKGKKNIRGREKCTRTNYFILPFGISALAAIGMYQCSACSSQLEDNSNNNNSIHFHLNNKIAPIVFRRTTKEHNIYGVSEGRTGMGYRK